MNNKSMLSSIQQLNQNKFKDYELSMELSRGRRKSPYLVEFEKRRRTIEEDPLDAPTKFANQTSTTINLVLQCARNVFLY